MNDTKRILITGATGFIGSYVCRYLVQQGYDVHITKRESSKLDLIHSVKDQVNIHNVSLQDINGLDQIIAQVDVIIHCAAIITIQPHTKDELFDVNVGITADLINLAIANKIEHFIFLSSVAALGLPKNEGMLDESNGWNDNDTHGDYGISKYRAELEVRRGEAEGLNISILNPSLVLGAGFWKNGTPSVISNLDGFVPFMPKGSNGFVDVRDIAEAVSNTVLNDEAYRKRIIISGHNSTLKDAFNLIRSKLGKSPVSQMLTRSNAWFFQILDAVRALSPSHQRLLTTEAVQIMSSSKKYNNALSKKVLRMKYRPFEETIDDVVNSYLQSKKNNKSFDLLSFG